MEIDAPRNAAAAQHSTELRKCENPKGIFFLLTLLFTWTLVDRGIIASNTINGSDDDGNYNGIRDDIEMSNFENGLLSSALSAGIIACSLFLARIAFRFPPMVIVGAGLLLWCVAAAASGLANSFYALFTCRFLMGVGEYPIFSLGSIVIDDVAPSRSTAFWLAVFYTAGPVGVACGFFIGSVLGSNMSWRYVFLFEASVALPFVLWCFATKPFDIQRDCETSNGAVAEGQEAVNGGSSAWRDLKRLMKHVIFDLSVSGDLLHFGFLTIFEYWGGRIVAAVFDNDQTDIYFGGAVVIGCILGGLIGGIVLDTIGSSVRNALSLSCVACFVTGIIVVPAILLLENFYVAVACILVCFAVASLPQGPLAGVALWTVPLDLRPLSRNVQTVLDYGIGSFPATALYGLAVDLLKKNHSEETSFRYATAGACLIVISAGAILLLGAFMSTNESDYRVRSGTAADADVSSANSESDEELLQPPLEDNLEEV